MASAKLKPHHPVKPGRWLGFFFWMVALVGMAAVAWELYQASSNMPLEARTFGLDGSKWLAFLGGWGAILGALTSARLALRNAIKQHTINTLLQMRMSETYISRVMRAAAVYFPAEGGLYLVRDDALTNPKKGDRIPDLAYVLNYLEFIASAIRYGDLDEHLMRESLRGMLCNNFECGRNYIMYRRANGEFGPNPLLFEHIEWLYRRWFVEKYKKKWMVRYDEPSSD